MRNLFTKIEISSSCSLGKKDRRDINKELQTDVLDKDKEYKVHKCRNKTKLISDSNSVVLFHFNKKYFPTIRYLEKNDTRFCEVYLDDGAVGPLSRGADVMIPGIFKYKDMIKGNFRAGDVVVVKIIRKSITAVGEALVGLEDICADKSGIGIEVYHRVDDELYNERFL